jgi:hypothetical protein
MRFGTDTSAAEWITTSGAHWWRLVTFGPPGFPAYAKLGLGGDDDPDVEPDPNEPDPVERAVRVLADYTWTPDECYFCLWDGWWETESAVTAVGAPEGQSPNVEIPNRKYFLLQGSLADYPEPPAWTELGAPEMAFIWPADRAWCLADDVDAPDQTTDTSPGSADRSRLSGR